MFNGFTTPRNQGFKYDTTVLIYDRVAHMAVDGSCCCLDYFPLFSNAFPFYSKRK